VTARGAAVALVAFAAFTDLVAYSVAVPVLPDLSRRLGASPTLIGLLFSSFGLSLVLVSVPMGAVSDRTGRRLPLILGMVALTAATLLFAYADSLAWLFAARLVQGAADAVTWVVGFALVADLYGPSERGRAMGLVMAGSNAGFMIGPSLGGWLYERGGMELPFLRRRAGRPGGAASCGSIAITRQPRAVSWLRAARAEVAPACCGHRGATRPCSSRCGLWLASVSACPAGWAGLARRRPPTPSNLRPARGSWASG
jgi:multidrug resistance protein